MFNKNLSTQFQVYWLNILNKDRFGHSVSNKLSLYSEINEISNFLLLFFSYPSLFHDKEHQNTLEACKSLENARNLSRIFSNILTVRILNIYRVQLQQCRGLSLSFRNLITVSVMTRIYDYLWNFMLISGPINNTA